MSIRTACTRFLTPAMIPALAGLVVAGALPAVPALAGVPGRAASPALHQTARIALGTTSSIFTNIFTEAPDGTVFYSKGPVVWTVAGKSAPKVAVHAGGKVMALAANSKDVFVQTGLTVTEYARAGGTSVRHWKLSSPVTPITLAGLIAVGGTLWSWTDWGTDSSGFEFARFSRINVSAPAVHVIDKQAFPVDVTADSSGLYFQDARGRDNTGFLVHAAPGGASHARKGPVGWPVALAGGRLYQLSFHNNGHQFIDGFSKTSLGRVTSARVPDTDRNIAGTKLGLLVLASPCSKLTCQNATVSKLAGNGKASGKLTVPHAFELLSGPDGAVVEVTSGHMFLVRIGS